MGFTDSEAAAQHQGEYGLVTNWGDNGKEAIKFVVGHIARQAATLLDKVSPGEDRVGRWIIRVGLQELVERTQRRQPPRKQ